MGVLNRESPLHGNRLVLSLPCPLFFRYNQNISQYSQPYTFQAFFQKGKACSVQVGSAAYSLRSQLVDYNDFAKPGTAQCRRSYAEGGASRSSIVCPPSSDDSFLNIAVLEAVESLCSVTVCRFPRSCSSRICGLLLEPLKFCDERKECRDSVLRMLLITK